MLRIMKYIVQEIALVKKAANKEKKFLLLKTDREKNFNADKENYDLNKGGNFIMNEEKVLEELEFERTEELALPPDVISEVKAIIGRLSKLIGYKYKAKYTYKKPAKSEEMEEKNTELSAYTDCMKNEMKAGKSMAEAAKICKVKAKGEEEDEKLGVKKVISPGSSEVSYEIVEALADLKETLAKPEFTKEQKLEAINKAIKAAGGE